MPDIFVNEVEEENQKEEPKTKTPPSSFHVFSSFVENPNGVEFEDRLKDEELLIFLRRHFVTNIPWLLVTILLVLIPLVISMLQSLGLLAIDFIPERFIIMIVLFYYLVVFGYAFVNYISWFYNISLVTSQRIIDIDFSQVVFENVAATKLTQVEDVSYSQIGVIRSIFDYGDVHIQTAGSASNFEFLAVPHPERVIKVVNELIGGKHHG